MLGLLCFLWMLAVMGRVTMQRFKAAKSRLAQTLALAYLGCYAALIIEGFFSDFFIPSAAGGGGTAAIAILAYHWLFFGLVLSIPNWDKEAFESSWL